MRRKSQHPNSLSWLTIDSLRGILAAAPRDTPRSVTDAGTVSQIWRILTAFDGGCMSSQSASRRDFLKLTGAGVATTALGVTASSYARIMGADDRVRVAICGLRGRGKDHLHGFATVP